MDELNDFKNELLIIKKQLEEKSNNLFLAAQYGNELLEKNSVLNSNIENLTQKYDAKDERYNQNNYTLNMKIAAKEETIKSLTNELEAQEKKHAEHIAKSEQLYNEEINKFNKKVNSLEAVNDYLNKEVSLHQEKGDDLQKRLEEVQEQSHETCQFNCEDNGLDDQILYLQQQVSSLTATNHEQEKEILSLKFQLKSSLIKIQAKDDELKRFESDLEEKECKITSLFNEFERNKCESVELRMEIDQLKMSQTDVNRKGNSLFGELEDNRQALEKRVISLNSKYSSMKKQTDLKNQQIYNLKLQVASVLNMTSSSVDREYVNYLKSSVDTAKEQLMVKIKRIEELENDVKKKSVASVNCEENILEKSMPSVMEILYDESQAKIKSFEEELRDLSFSNASLHNKILELRSNLYRSEKNNELSKIENVKLRAELDNVKASKDLSLSDVKESNKLQIIIEEIIPSLDTPNGVEKDTDQPIQENVIHLGKPALVKAEDESCNSSAISKSLPEKMDKENVSPNLNKITVDNIEVKKCARSVAFHQGDDEDLKMEMAPAKEIKTKLRRKMEAPNIIVTQQDSQSEECKVQ